ncbi:hypothetical protein PF007_g15585 [Phytophthora fragariae]|uniref:Uncharacterized protein n=2 Tax=Phytophthora fragariae TaxID=53985 RepID=A0A6A3RMD8_9STRA|nr:hypothetical protein PF007_g15585 [Phytophthora fragariae]
MVRLVHSAVHWSAQCILESSSEDESVPLDVQRSAPARPPHPEGGVKSSPDDGFDGWRLGNPRRPRRPKQLQLRLQPRRPHGTLVVQQHRLRSCSKNHHPHARDLRRRHPDGRPVSAVGGEPHATSDKQLLDRTRAVTTVVVTRHRRRCHEPVSCAQPVGRRLSFRRAQLARVVLTSKTASFQRGGRYPSPIFARSSTPTGVVFPRVPHFGWCDCEVPCRVGRCHNLLMQLYCNVNCCPYGGNCGNSVVESTEVALVKNVVARQLAVVAQEFIAAGVILGEYLGEIEHSRDRRDLGTNMNEMAKLSVSANYKLSEVRRLLALVEHYLPLGKDESGMPPHVQLAKQLKQAIDDKASVVDMDDAADVDQAEEEEYPQDFSFDFEGDEGLDDNTRVHDGWEHHLQRLDALR